MQIIIVHSLTVIEIHCCCCCFIAGGVLLFVTRKLDSEQVAANLQIQGYSGETFHCKYS